MSKNATGPQVDQNRGDDGQSSTPSLAQGNAPTASSKVKRLGIEVQDHDKKQGYWYDSIGDVSDGFHTFNELYDFRLLYNAALFNFWGAGTPMYNVHKSYRHADAPTESIFGKDWFIVMATLPTGQISNHYAPEYWDLFQIPEREVADTWDGHTTADVADRLRRFVQGNDLVKENPDDK